MADADFEDRVKFSLTSIRPYLLADGGDVQFVRFRPDGVLEVQWIGMCRICPMSQLTLRAGVERAIMKDLPEVNRVEAVVPPA